MTLKKTSLLFTQFSGGLLQPRQIPDREKEKTMAKKYAFLFPGQGAQAQGMIKDICEAYPEARLPLSNLIASSRFSKN